MKQEYTEITSENWEQFKGMDFECRDSSDLQWEERTNLTFCYVECWDHVRIKDVEEVEKPQVDYYQLWHESQQAVKAQSIEIKDLKRKAIQIPSNLTKAEGEEALKRASENKVELDRWYLVDNGVPFPMWLNKNKQWGSYQNHNDKIEFGRYKIISPMYTQEELNQSKGE